MKLWTMVLGALLFCAGQTALAAMARQTQGTNGVAGASLTTLAGTGRLVQGGYPVGLRAQSYRVWLEIRDEVVVGFPGLLKGERLTLVLCGLCLAGLTGVAANSFRRARRLSQTRPESIHEEEETPAGCAH